MEIEIALYSKICLDWIRNLKKTITKKMKIE